MPYIITLKPQDFSVLANAPLGEAIARAGSTVGDAISSKRKLDQAKELQDRKLDIEERRAEAQILREQRLSAGGGTKPAVDAELEAFREQSAGDPAAAAGQALRSPKGFLGPFGFVADRGAKAATAAAQTQARIDGHIELARRMTPAAARAYLQRFRGEESKRIYAQSYERVATAIKDGVAEGYISQGDANKLTKALTASMKAGGSPDAITDTIAQQYDLVAKLRQRADAWGKADETATQLLSTMYDLAKNAPTYDAQGNPLRESMMKSLATAQTEWQRTSGQAFRQKTDPEDSLAGLHQIIFQSQAKSDPQAFLAQSGRAIGQMPREQAPEAAQPERKPARHSAAGPSPKTSERLQTLVREGSSAALRAGSQEKRREAMRSLLERAARELGVDPTDPKVLSIVREALSQQWERP